MRKLSVWLILLCSAVVGLTEDEYSPSVLVTPLSGVAPAIDGSLDDVCWRNAARIEDFRLFGQGTAPEAQTVAWVTADAADLYIAFRCAEVAGRTASARNTGRMGDVHGDDSVEVFLGQPGQYFHFVLGAGNAKYEQRVSYGLQFRKHRDWDVPWRSATRTGPDGWTAEMALPLHIFGRTLPAAPLGFNLTRTRQLASRQFITWAPVQTSFHDPERFGQLTGLEGRVVRSAFAPILGSAVAEPYTFDHGTVSYTVRAAVSNRGGLGGDARLLIAETLATGATRRVTHTLTIPPVAENREYVVKVQTEAPVARTARAWIATAADPDGEPIEVNGAAGLVPFDAFCDRNYYTREENVRIYTDTVFADAGLHGMRMDLKLTSPDGREVHSARAAASNGPAFIVPVRILPAGASVATLTLVDASGRTIGSKALTLERFPPAPEGVTEAKLDQVNECILLDGEPWFPQGFMMYGGMTAENIREVAAGGFNALVRWWVVGGRGFEQHMPHVKETLDVAGELGLKVFDTATGFAPRLRYSRPDFRTNYKTSVKNLPAVIETIGQHPALVGYYGLDEPGSAYFDLGTLTYAVAHERDPYHLMYSSGNSVWPDSGYEIFDLLGVHGYWDPHTSTENKFMRRVAGMSIVAGRHHRPFLVTPQTFRGDYVRNFTPRELRNSLYICLIYGAKGIIYFRHPVYHPAYWQASADIAAEIQTLTPTLMRRSPPQKVVVNLRSTKGRAPLPPGPAAALAGFRPIQDLGEELDLPLVPVLVKDRAEGGELMLAANAWRDPVDATFTANFLGASATVRECFTGKTYSVRDGAFEDRLGPFAVRAYIIEKGAREPGSVVRVGVNLARAGQGTSGATPAAVAENLVQQPGFEQDGAWDLCSGQGKLVEFEPHTGARCLQVDAPQDGKPHARSYQRVPVEPGKKYEVGVWVRSAITEGAERPRFCFYGLAGLSFSPQQGEWQLLKTTVRPDKDILLIGPHVAPGSGSVWIDDVVVRPVPLPETPNQIVNASFEEQTYAGAPDNWDGFELRSERMRVYADGEDAFDGDQSLVIKWDSNRPYFTAVARATFAWPDRRPDVPYTVAFAVKAIGEPAPVEVWFSGARGGKLTTEVMPAAEWKRHTWTFTIPKADWEQWWHGAVGVGFRPLKTGTVRVDAVQFEQAAEASAFTTADYKAPVIDQKYRGIRLWAQ